MNYFTQTVLNHLNNCKGRASAIESELKTMPEGHINCYRNGNYYTWIHIISGKPAMLIPKSNRGLAELLARKKLLCTELNELNSEIKACNKYLKQVSTYNGGVQKLLDSANKGFLDLISIPSNSNDQRIVDWKNAPFKQSRSHPESLRIPAADGTFVRSKLESQFIQILLSLDIPYKYEQIHVIGGHEIASDFTVLDTRNWENVIIELFGIMDDPKYRETYNKKMSVYLRNGFIPDINMLCFYESQDAPLDINYCMLRLKYFFGKQA